MSTSPENRPNILLLMTDQQRFDTINAAGHSHMRTPNLDRLVNEGCLFTNGYSPNPVCVPARHCTLTGTRESQHGITANGMATARLEGLPTMPQVLSDHGYFTAAVGKMHWFPNRRHHGFAEMHLMEEIPKHRCDDAYAEHLAANGHGDLRCVHGVRPLIYHAPQAALVPEALHGVNFVADRTCEVIDRNRGERPFFIWSSWIKPHPPWNIPESWSGHYDGIDLPDAIPGPRPQPAPTEASDWYGDNDDPAHARSIRAAYFTTISMVDAAIGRVLDHLQARGDLDNTIIIFTSDHGEMLQDHGLYQKHQPYESSTHVPFIIRYPKHFTAGSRESAFVDLCDIMPTALDAAGISAADIRAARPWDPAGSSLLRLDEQGGRDRQHQFCSFAAERMRWLMVRNDRYKYIFHYNGGVEHLYDLDNDPQEMNNLLAQGTAPAAVHQQLRQLALAHEGRWGLADHLDQGQPKHLDCDISGHANASCKFPPWSSRHFPLFGTDDLDTEAQRFTDEVLRATAHHGQTDYIAQWSPEPAAWESFFDDLRDRGVSEAMMAKMRQQLGLPAPA